MMFVQAPETDSVTERSNLQPVSAKLTGKARVIPLSKIHTNSFNPRLAESPDTFNELIDSIRDVGLLQPILVLEKNDLTNRQVVYEIIAGRRRLEAVKQLGQSEIAANVLPNIAEHDRALASLRENVDRKNLTDYEVFLSLRFLENHYVGRLERAKTLGLCRSMYYRVLSFGKLPKYILEDLNQAPGLLTGKSAEALSKVLNYHGDYCLMALPKLWQQVLSGDLRQSQLAGRLESMLMEKGAGRVRPDVRPLTVGTAQAGTFHASKHSIHIKIDAAYLPDGHLDELIGKITSQLELYEAAKIGSFREDNDLQVLRRESKTPNGSVLVPTGRRFDGSSA